MRIVRLAKAPKLVIDILAEEVSVYDQVCARSLMLRWLERVWEYACSQK